MCAPADLKCHITDGFADVASNAMNGLARMVGKAALDGIQAIASFWIDKPSPTLATGSGQDWANSDPVQFLQGNVMWVAAVIFTVAVLIAGIRVAWEQRAKPLQDLLKATMLFVVVSAAGTATMQLLAGWSDDFAKALVVSVAGKEDAFATQLGAMMLLGHLSGVAGGNPVPDLLMLFAGVMVVFASLMQVVLMVVRSAMLILLAGTFPLAAAATNTELGRTWFKKYCGWTLAFVAYKPAAALIYTAALTMNQKGMVTSSNSFVQTTTGLMMLFLAIFALPALLRFMVPVTAAVAGGGAGMGSSVADPGGLATGAINVGRSSLGRGSGSGGGAAAASSGGSSASGAVGVGAAAGPAAVGLAAAGAAVNGARKVAGGLAGAAAHSAGESGGGSITPTSSFGPMSRGGSRARLAKASSSSGSAGQGRVTETAGPSGSR